MIPELSMQLELAYSNPPPYSLLSLEWKLQYMEVWLQSEIFFKVSGALREAVEHSVICNRAVS